MFYILKEMFGNDNFSSIDSEISNNHSANNMGGGIMINDESNVDIKNTTISYNSARTGGGIGAFGYVSLRDVEIINNEAVSISGNINEEIILIKWEIEKIS